VAGGVLTLSKIPSGVAFWVHVTPRAKRAGVAGCHGGALRVAVAAPPADGLANAACVRALAEALGVKRSDVELDPGSKGRRKRVRVSGKSDALSQRLAELAAAGSND
jgi:uncharacterized protein (TIGR00251 family)